VSAIDSRGRTIWIADAHLDDGKRFVVRAEEKLTAFVELEAAIRAARCRPNAYSSTRSSPPQSAGSESKIVSESVHGCPHGSRNEHWRSPYM
jgi:hypothetical protein